MGIKPRWRQVKINTIDLINWIFDYYWIESNSTQITSNSSEVQKIIGGRHRHHVLFCSWIVSPRHKTKSYTSQNKISMGKFKSSRRRRAWILIMTVMTKHDLATLHLTPSWDLPRVIVQSPYMLFSLFSHSFRFFCLSLYYPLTYLVKIFPFLFTLPTLSLSVILSWLLDPPLL
jgi:hypothetical protein